MLEPKSEMHWHSYRSAIPVGVMILGIGSLWLVTQFWFLFTVPKKEFIEKSMTSMFSSKPEKSVLLPSGKRVPKQFYDALTLLPNDYRDSLVKQLSVPDGSVSRFLKIESVSSPKTQEGGSFAYTVVGEMVTTRDGKRVKVEPFKQIVVARCKERLFPCEGEIVGLRNWGG